MKPREFRITVQAADNEGQPDRRKYLAVRFVPTVEWGIANISDARKAVEAVTKEAIDEIFLEIIRQEKRRV